MVTIEKLTGVEGIAYQYSLEEWSKLEKEGLNASTSKVAMAAAVKAGPQVADEIVSYMDGSKKFDQDNGAQRKESEGRKLILGEIAAPDLDAWREKRKAKKGRKTPKPKQVESFGESGEKLDFEEAVLLGKGYHPKTGEDLVTRNKKDPDNRTFGNDVQFGAPKSVSTIWGLASSAAHKGSAVGLRYKLGIEAAQAAGVKRALQYAHENGLFIARRSEAKHGHEGAGMVIFGQYDHYTNRNGEPHVHTHNLWFNVCVRSDGTTGAVDNRQLKAHAAIIGALYRMEMAAHLRENLGLRASKVDRNFEIDGVSEELIVALSTRRKEVVDYLAQMGIDNTAEHREAAKHASRNTRKSKDEQLPLVELYDVWDNLAREHGVTFESLVESVQEAAAKKYTSETEDWIKKQVENNLNGKQNADATRPEFDLNEIKARAYAAVVETSSAFAERRILKAVFEELQVYTNVDTAVKVVDDLISSGDLIPLSKKKDDLYFTTAEIATLEQELVNDALSMLGNLEIMDPNTVRHFVGKQVVDDKGNPIFKEDGSPAYLKPEQIEAVKHACGADQITVVHGAAGSGKSKMLGTVADIHRTLGQEVHAIAPSHKAKQVIAADANIEQEMARAVAGFISAYEKGKITITSKSTIIPDESGMIGLDDMRKLVEIARKTGARLVLSGDKYQLPSIARGAPLALLSRPDICGAAYLLDIVRQKDPRQCDASVLMAKGETAAGLQHYVDTRRVSFTDTAMKDTMTAYMADREENPKASRMIGVFRNAHATQLNLKSREGLKEDGTLKGQGFTIEAWTRGLNQRVVEREFNEGEKIIFGETFRIGDMEISNNTTGTILKIEMAGNEPVFTIRTEGPDPKTFTARPSEMVGYRDEKAKDKTTPKIDYAYAQTVYSLQGSTFDRMFIYAGEAGNSELAYVMLTRHRLDCQVFVDRTRIYDELAAKAGKIMHLNKKTGAAPEENMSIDGEPTEEEIRATWIKENSVSGRKLNVCDFHESVEEFLGKDFAKQENGEMKKMRDDEKSPQQTNAYADAKGRTEQPAAEPIKPPVMGARPPMPRGIGPIGGAPAAKQEVKAEPQAPAKPSLAEKALDRLNNGKAGKVVEEARAKRQDKIKKLPPLPKQELEQMARYNLVDYFESVHKFTYLNSYQPKQGVEGHFLHKKDVGKISVIQRGDGTWNWALRDGSAKGMIWDYSVWRGQKIEDALRTVKDQLGSAIYSAPVSSTPRIPAEPQAPKTLAERIQAGGVKQYVSETYADMRKWVGSMIDRTMKYGRGVNPYLRDVRGIDVQTQRCFPGQIGTESNMGKKNPNGATFAHKDLEGNIWNVERKGIKQEGAKRSFSEMGPGTKRLGLLGDIQNPSRIYVAESIIDGISLFQADGRPERSLIASTFGNPSDEGLHDLHELAKRNPGVDFHIAMDNDSAGRNFAAMVEDSVKLARGEEANVVDRHPPEEYKDWNDQVRGIKITAEDRAADELKSKSLAEDRAKAAEPRQELKRPAASRPPMPLPKVSKWDQAKVAVDEDRKKRLEEAARQPDWRGIKPKGPTL